VFRQLEDEQLRRITELLLEETRHRLQAREVSLEVTPEALDRLARIGHQGEYGARPLRRTIQREIDNELSRRLLDGRVAPGQTVEVGVGPDGFEFEAA
jgi:ATP-dependent Clp protease ATP-binding subunit ClpC